MHIIQKLRNKISLPLGHASIGKRDDDQYLASFPRSGSTWLRTMLVDIMDPEANSNPDVFNAMIPGVSLTQIPKLRRLPSPRIIQSHTIYRPVIKRAVYTVRDGRDVLPSFYHYMTTRKGKPMAFEPWFDLYESGVYGKRWDESVLSWMDKGKQVLGDDLMVVHFERMKSQPVDVLLEVTQHLGIACEKSTIEKVAGEATIENARKIEKEREKNREGNTSFYRGGTTGQWEKYFTPELEKRFWDLSADAMALAGYQK